MITDTDAQKLIRAVEEADSSISLVKAVQKLAEAQLTEAIPTLIAALNYNNPGAAVAAVEGLVQLGEASVQPLLELIDNYNYGARAWAIRALAGIGDPRALNTLLDAAKADFALSVRRAAARGLGTIQWHKLLPEQIEPAQSQVLEALLLVCQDPEWVVRYAAVTGLESLTLAQPKLSLQVLTQLEHIIQTDTDLAVCTRVRMAQQQLQSITKVL